MASPFPGMDPFLEQEKYWSRFENRFIRALVHAFLPAMVDRYHPRLERRRYVVEQTLFTSILREEHADGLVEIDSVFTDEPVTAILLVTPMSRTTKPGRESYLESREYYKNQGCNLVEIDLVLQGSPILTVMPQEAVEWDYAVTVTRPDRPDHHETYTSTLQKRLPRFRLPLAPDDRDAVVDLQRVFTRAYEQGDFADLIDYSEGPRIKLSDDKLLWIDEYLRRLCLR